MWYGVRRETGAFWADGSPHPVGQGASIHGDGQNARLHHIEAATRFAPLEVWEAKNPFLMERCELAPRLGRAGNPPRRSRRGHGVPVPRGRVRDLDDRADEERPAGAWPGVLPAAPTPASSGCRTGRPSRVAKATGLPLPAGSTFAVHCGGGGGYGPPGGARPRGRPAGHPRGLHHRGARSGALPARVLVAERRRPDRQTVRPIPAHPCASGERTPLGATSAPLRRLDVVRNGHVSRATDLRPTRSTITRKVLRVCSNVLQNRSGFSRACG